MKDAKPTELTYPTTIQVLETVSWLIRKKCLTCKSDGLSSIPEPIVKGENQLLKFVPAVKVTSCRGEHRHATAQGLTQASVCAK